VLAESIPIYPLYALLFSDAGLSGAQISTLFLLWSAVGIVAEVPAGAMADRFSRRGALVVSGVLQATGYLLWTTVPGYAAFAAGFVLWGLGGAFGSGALEALVYDGMASAGAEEHYVRIYGRVTSAGLLGQLPAAIAATALFSTGGYELVGWVSVACCLAAAAVATRLPETRPKRVRSTGSGSDPRYFAVLRSGLAEAARSPAVRAAVVAVAVLGGLDGLEEYFTLLARDWGVTTTVVPLAVLGIPLAGAAGAALGGVAGHLRPRTLAALLTAAVAVFGGAGLLRRPAGVAGIALAYGLYQLVAVVTEARLQERIEGSARATVTSVAAVGNDLTAIALYAMWALNQPVLVVVAVLAMAAGLPWLLRPRRTGPDRTGPVEPADREDDDVDDVSGRRRLGEPQQVAHREPTGLLGRERR